MNKSQALQVLNDNTGKTAAEMAGWQRAAIRQAIYIVRRTATPDQKILADEIEAIMDGRLQLWETKRTEFLELDDLIDLPRAAPESMPRAAQVLAPEINPTGPMDYQSAIIATEEIVRNQKQWPAHEWVALSENYSLFMYHSRTHNTDKWKLYEVDNGVAGVPAVATGYGPRS